MGICDPDTEPRAVQVPLVAAVQMHSATAPPPVQPSVTVTISFTNIPVCEEREAKANGAPADTRPPKVAFPLPSSSTLCVVPTTPVNVGEATGARLVSVG